MLAYLPIGAWARIAWFAASRQLLQFITSDPMMTWGPEEWKPPRQLRQLHHHRLSPIRNKQALNQTIKAKELKDKLDLLRFKKKIFRHYQQIVM